MKKFIFSLLACFAMVQSTYAATSGLTESLLEYEAIISALGSNPSFENVIPQTEFIVDINRLTRQIDVLGEVKYEIFTRPITADNSASKGKCDRKHSRTIRYVATLNVAPNPGVGPNIVTVVSIVLQNTHKHHH